MIVICCNGDSNTQSGFQAGLFGDDSTNADGWVERLQVKLDNFLGAGLALTINRGVLGTSITSNVTTDLFINSELAHLDPFLVHSPISWLGQPVFNPFPSPDVYIISLGTNDLIGLVDPATILDAIKTHGAQITARGAQVLIATTPPQFAPATVDPAKIMQLNRLITRTYHARAVDFFTGMVVGDYYADGIHLTPAGMEKRAQAAFNTVVKVMDLVPAVPPDPPAPMSSHTCAACTVCGLPHAHPGMP